MIPALAIRPTAGNEDGRYLVARSGYEDGSAFVFLTRLEGLETHYDPLHWHGNRTLQTAHQYLVEHWAEVVSGAVIDVEYILGERDQPKQPERLERLELTDRLYGKI
jgi:hypothetical protein